MTTRRKFRAVLAAAGAVGLLSFDATAQSPQQRQGSERRSQSTATQTATAQGYDTFRTLQTRNIFDPDRRPMVPPATPQATQPASSADYVALTGVMVTSEKSLAFFSGSRSEYSKVVAVNADIAGAKLMKITPANIEVERDGKRISVNVGQTVPLNASAQPGAAPIAATTAATLPESSPSSAATNAPSSTAPPANASEVLRRMMERRQQQLK